MSPADPRALREHFSVYLCGIQYPPKKHLEISSFDTTVRRRPDRSRPPQVGPTGHTCTETADRTVTAKHTKPGVTAFPHSRPFSETLHAFPSAPAEPAKPGGRIRGARGELFPPHAFPAFSAFPAFKKVAPLFGLPVRSRSLGSGACFKDGHSRPRGERRPGGRA